MHESFYSATLIEFVIFDNEHEKVIASYESFQDLPSNLHDELENDSLEITFQELPRLVENYMLMGELMHWRISFNFGH